MNLNIGDKLKRFRNKREFTLKELSELSGISVSFLSDIENGRRNPSTESLSKIAKALGVSTDKLLGKSLDSLIETRLQELNINMKDLAEKTELSTTYLKSLPNTVPDQGDYNNILTIAQALKMQPGPLFTALSRQEAPVYDGSTSSPEDDFFRPAKEVRSIENAERIAPLLDSIPTEFTNPKEARDYIAMHQIFGSDGLDPDKLDDDEIIEFANELLKQMNLISFKYRK